MKNRIYIILSILALFSLLIACGGGDSGGGGGGSVSSSESSSPQAGTASVTLTWDAPTTNTDGSDLTDLDGYRVYYGTSSGRYSNSANIGNFTTAVVSNLSTGATWYITVTAYNSSGHESDYATEVTINL